MKINKIIVASAIISMMLLGCSQQKETKDMTTSTNSQKAVVTTDKGAFEITLDASAAPKTVENFVNKSKSGYYNGKIFHRVEDWVVQGGDPKGDGTGGGDQATELSDRNFKEGAVGVARGGDINISNDSQFFICTKDSSFLNNQYTYFGEVTTGMDIVKKIQIGDKIDSIEIK
jgi:peptidyl-prolyl cis-trans isomerase B (cyclophilin B)